MNKKDLSERDICSKFINPAILKSGWDFQKQVREEVSFTDGRIIVQGKLYARGRRKRADYILYYKPNHPIAIIEVCKDIYSGLIRKAIDQEVYVIMLPVPKGKPD